MRALGNAKKIGTIALAMALLCGLSACGKTGPAASETSASSETSISSVASAATSEKTESQLSEAFSSEASSEEEPLTKEQEQYLSIVKGYPSITMSELKTALAQKKELLVYAGRVTCPYCVKLTPILEKIVKENNLPLVALDTEKETGFADFAKEHDIETIPAVMQIRNGKLTHADLQSPYRQSEVEGALKQAGVSF